MKTIEQLKAQTPVYLHIFKDRESVIHEFAPTWASKTNANDFEGVQILFASYGQDNWSGEAWVLFEQDGKLFEVNGSHCSCYGLEDQWEPQETALEAIKLRLDKGHLGTDNYSGNEFAVELREFLYD